MRHAELGLLLLLGAAGCIDRTGGRRFVDAIAPGTVQPEVAPIMLNDEPPFRYPPALWTQRVQGNVVLRIHVDANGIPVADSSVVAEPSGIPALDTAALAGVRDLRFSPARLRGEPVGASLMIPVFFRHPDAPPLPGDSALRTIGRKQSPR